MNIRNFGEKGSQCLAIERQIKAKKLKGGPAIPGMIQPMIPMKTKMMPRMIRNSIFFAR
jgi:hypothetical protein